MPTEPRAAGPGGVMLKEVTCQCGWQTRGTEAEVIAQVMEHGRAAHGQELTPEEVMAIWQDVS